MVEAVESIQTTSEVDPKARIKQLYREKDQVTQQLQRTPSTKVSDGVLLGAAAGIGTTWGIYEAASVDRIAEKGIAQLLSKITIDKEGVITNFDQLKEHVPDALKNVFNQDIVEGYHDLVSKFGNSETLQKQIKQQLTGGELAQASKTQIDAFAKTMASFIESAAKQKDGIPADFPDKIQELARKHNVEQHLKSEFWEPLVDGVKTLQGHEIPTAYKKMAQAQTDGNVVTKLQPLRWVADTMHSGSWQQKTVASMVVTGLFVAAVVAANKVMGQGKEEKRTEIKSHLERLNERIAAEQKELGISV